MQDLVPERLPELEAYRLDGLDAGPGALYPFYNGYSLANLPSSICHWLGLPGFGGPPLNPHILNLFSQRFQHVIMLVVDGMGLNTMQAALERSQRDPAFAVWDNLSDGGILAPLTSIAPSTTAAALTTLWTGRTPAEHGVVGFEVWLKEYGLIANMIYHSPASFGLDLNSLRKAGFSAETFLPVPTLGPHLLKHGVRSFAFQHHSIAHSGLSSMLMPGVQVIPYRSLSDLWVTLNALSETTAAEKTYTYIYWGDLDEHSHRFGPEDPRVDLELTAFSQRLNYFVRAQQARGRGDTLFLVTADHGHISTPRRAEYEIRNHPDLFDCLVMLPSGEARLPYVYLHPGMEERFVRYLDETWQGQFIAVPSEQVIRAGLFGADSQCRELSERVGDFVIFPQESAYWWFASRDNPLLGRHGGLNRTEMLIPLLASVF